MSKLTGCAAEGAGRSGSTLAYRRNSYGCGPRACPDPRGFLVAIHGELYAAAPADLPTASGGAGRRRASTSWGICLWPLMRRKDRSALSIPAAVQRSTIWPSRQRVTLRLVVRAIEIIDSMGLLVVRVLARRPSMPSRATVNISSSPSRSDAAALG